jgi:hypothetical protein
VHEAAAFTSLRDAADPHHGHVVGRGRDTRLTDKHVGEAHMRSTTSSFPMTPGGP